MKKFIAAVVSVAMCLVLAPCAFAGEWVDCSEQFEDVSDNEYYVGELNYALYHGFVNGTGSGLFAPDESITRGQFITMLGRALGVVEDEAEPVFEDVPIERYYASYIDWAAEAGYVGGISPRRFAPESVLTLEQMCAILADFVQANADVMNLREVTDAYKISENVSEWAKEAIQVCKECGLVSTGFWGDIFPTEEVSRADAVVAVTRLVRMLKHSAPEVSYESLMFGEYELIASHALEDEDAIDNNIRYMLKNGLTEIVLDASGVEWNTDGSDYGGAYAKVLQQYPEFGYKFVRTYGSDGDLIIVIYGLPYDEVELAGYQEDAMNAAIAIRASLYDSGELHDGMTETEKARVYYDWIVENCDYDWMSYYGRRDIPFAWMNYGVVVRHFATCQGYTAAYDLFLRLEGIETLAIQVPTHIWTSAKLDGVWYHSDPCWPDWKDEDPEEFFLMTPEDSMARDMT